MPSTLRSLILMFAFTHLAAAPLSCDLPTFSLRPVKLWMGEDECLVSVSHYWALAIVREIHPVATKVIPPSPGVGWEIKEWKYLPLGRLALYGRRAGDPNWYFAGWESPMEMPKGGQSDQVHRRFGNWGTNEEPSEPPSSIRYRLYSHGGNVELWKEDCSKDESGKDLWTKKWRIWYSENNDWPGALVLGDDGALRYQNFNGGQNQQWPASPPGMNDKKTWVADTYPPPPDVVKTINTDGYPDPELKCQILGNHDGWTLVDSPRSWIKPHTRMYGNQCLISDNQHYALAFGTHHEEETRHVYFDLQYSDFSIEHREDAPYRRVRLCLFEWDTSVSKWRYAGYEFPYQSPDPNADQKRFDHNYLEFDEASNLRHVTYAMGDGPFRHHTAWDSVDHPRGYLLGLENGGALKILCPKSDGTPNWDADPAWQEPKPNLATRGWLPSNGYDPPEVLIDHPGK